MVKFKNLLLYAVCVGLMAGFVVLITNLLQSLGIVTNDGSLTFITFACWASYFLFGANIKGAVSAFLGFIVGIIGSIIIFTLAGIFAGYGMNASLIAIPIAVSTVVLFMVLCEKVPYFNNVAAIFLGTSLFFALMGTPAIGSEGYGIAAFGLLLYATIGFASGWITVLIRVVLEKRDQRSSDNAEKVLL